MSLSLSSIGPNILANGVFLPGSSPVDFGTDDPSAGKYPGIARSNGTTKKKYDGGTTMIPNWTVTTGSVAWNAAPNYRNIVDPTGKGFCVDLTNWNYDPDRTSLDGGYGFLYGQIVSDPFPTTPGRHYLLSLDVGTYETKDGGGALDSGAPVAVITGAGDLPPNTTVAQLAPIGSSGSQWLPCTKVFTATAASTTVALRGYIPTAFHRQQSNFIGVAMVMVNELQFGSAGSLLGDLEQAALGLLTGDIGRLRRREEDALSRLGGDMRRLGVLRKSIR